MLPTSKCQILRSNTCYQTKQKTNKLQHKIGKTNILSRGEGWDPSNRFDPIIYICLSQATTCILNVRCRVHCFFLIFNDLRLEVTVRLYWWNCCTSLFKLSIHKVSTLTKIYQTEGEIFFLMTKTSILKIL